MLCNDDPADKVNVCKPDPRKASASISVTLAGRVTDVSDEQLWKACDPMRVTDSGMVTEIRVEVQLWKALLGIFVTPSGMVTWVAQVFHGADGGGAGGDGSAHVTDGFDPGRLVFDHGVL